MNQITSINKVKNIKLKKNSLRINELSCRLAKTAYYILAHFRPDKHRLSHSDFANAFISPSLFYDLSRTLLFPRLPRFPGRLHVREPKIRLHDALCIRQPLSLSIHTTAKLSSPVKHPRLPRTKPRGLSANHGGPRSPKGRAIS